MRVLVIGPSPTRSKGGMATVISEIYEDAQLNKEFDIDIFESFIDGGKIKRVVYSFLAYLKFFFTKKDYDVYHIHAASRRSTFRKGYYVRKAKKWGKKVILHIHGSEYIEYYGELSEKRKRAMVDILEAADLVIALSAGWKEKFERTFGIKNCVILENGIDLVKFQKARTIPERYQHSFVMLGHLRKKKGTYDLIEAVVQAVKTVPDIKVYLAGDGDIEQIRSIVQNKHLENNVKIVGWVCSTEKVELLSKVSSVILPSYNEGLPMSLLEGMACGKAIISTKVGAIPEVVNTENGILVEAGDIKGIAEALIKCSTDLAYVEAVSERNIAKIAEKYSMRTMHEKLGKYYWMLFK